MKFALFALGIIVVVRIFWYLYKCWTKQWLRRKLIEIEMK